MRRWISAVAVLLLAMMTASCALTPPGFTAPDSKTLTAFTGDGCGAGGIGAGVYAVGCWKEMDVVR